MKDDYNEGCHYNYWSVVLFRRSRSRDKHSRTATPERKAPVNAEGAITIKDEPLDKVAAKTCLNPVRH